MGYSHRTRSPSGPAVANAACNRAKALEFRIKGKRYHEIAEALGVSRSMAHKYVVESLDELNALCLEQAEQIRRLENERLDRMLDALDFKVAAGDPVAINTALKIQERRARLWGLDAKADTSGLGQALSELLSAGSNPPAPSKDADEAAAPSDEG